MKIVLKVFIGIVFSVLLLLAIVTFISISRLGDEYTFQGTIQCDLGKSYNIRPNFKVDEYAVKGGDLSVNVAKSIECKDNVKELNLYDDDMGYCVTIEALALGHITLELKEKKFMMSGYRIYAYDIVVNFNSEDIDQLAIRTFESNEFLYFTPSKLDRSHLYINQETQDLELNFGSKYMLYIYDTNSKEYFSLKSILKSSRTDTSMRIYCKETYDEVNDCVCVDDDGAFYINTFRDGKFVLFIDRCGGIEFNFKMNVNQSLAKAINLSYGKDADSNYYSIIDAIELEELNTLKLLSSICLGFDYSVLNNSLFANVNMIDIEIDYFDYEGCTDLYIKPSKQIKNVNISPKEHNDWLFYLFLNVDLVDSDDVLFTFYDCYAECYANTEKSVFNSVNNNLNIKLENSNLEFRNSLFDNEFINNLSLNLVNSTFTIYNQTKILKIKNVKILNDDISQVKFFGRSGTNGKNGANGKEGTGGNSGYRGENGTNGTDGESALICERLYIEGGSVSFAGGSGGNGGNGGNGGKANDWLHGGDGGDGGTGGNAGRGAKALMINPSVSIDGLHAISIINCNLTITAGKNGEPGRGGSGGAGWFWWNSNGSGGSNGVRINDKNDIYLNDYDLYEENSNIVYK